MELFSLQKLKFRRKILVLAGAKIHITSVVDDHLVGYIKMKAFKLKEDIRVYSDTTLSKQLLVIKARQIIDIGATYDVYEGDEQTKVCAIKREGVASIFVRDRWYFLDNNDQRIAIIEEVGAIALVRRWIGLIPILGGVVDTVLWFKKMRYELRAIENNIEASLLGVIERQKNPFVVSYISDTTCGEVPVDQRLMVAATTMLSVIEASKN